MSGAETPKQMRARIRREAPSYLSTAWVPWRASLTEAEATAYGQIIDRRAVLLVAAIWVVFVAALWSLS